MYIYIYIYVGLKRPSSRSALPAAPSAGRAGHTANLCRPPIIVITSSSSSSSSSSRMSIIIICCICIIIVMIIIIISIINSSSSSKYLKILAFGGLDSGRILNKAENHNCSK